jgi:prepilin-type N-terminal cleavage/methylation domain-containing protein
MRKKGFTLIEIAIVLIIIGLLLGLGAGLIGILTKRAKLIDTREMVNAAVESVIGYTITNGTLPDNATFPIIIRSSNDAWGKPLAYIYDKTLKDSHICNANGTNITVKVCPDVSCSSPVSTTNNVAFIVLSGGPNYNIQTSGSKEITSPTTIKVYNPDVDNVDDYPGDMNRPEPYDDIVKWIPLEELKTKLGCPGTPAPPSYCSPGSPVDLITNNKIYYCFFETDYKTECDDEVGACDLLKSGEKLTISSGDKVRIYSKKSGNRCKGRDALTVNPGSKPCLGYNVGTCTDIKYVDTNNNCLVEGTQSDSNYYVTDK